MGCIWPSTPFIFHATLYHQRLWKCITFLLVLFMFDRTSTKLNFQLHLYSHADWWLINENHFHLKWLFFFFCLRGSCLAFLYIKSICFSWFLNSIWFQKLLPVSAHLVWISLVVNFQYSLTSSFWSTTLYHTFTPFTSLKEFDNILFSILFVEAMFLVNQPEHQLIKTSKSSIN